MAMRKVYSNMANVMADYVEIIISDKVAIKYKGKNAVGCDVDECIFSRSSAYDDLVGKGKKFLTMQEAEEYGQQLAQKFGLKEDVGLAHRRKLWVIK